MTTKICPLMSKVTPGGWSRDEQRFVADELCRIECQGDACQFWEIQTGTCGLVTQGFLAGRAAITEEIRAERKTYLNGG